MKYLFVALLILASNAFSKSTADLSGDIKIYSQELGYYIQYRAFLPPDYSNNESLPVIYVTDGHEYINKGKMHNLLNRLIKSNKIEPLIAVFIDPRDPDNLTKSRRSSELFCNHQYVKFISSELVQSVDSNYKTATTPNKRVILGLSDGGLNSVCTGVLAPDIFEGVGMMSAQLRTLPEIFTIFQKSKKLPLNFYLTAGSGIYDTRKQTREFFMILEEKGYSAKIKLTNKKHDWRNWKSVLDDVLIYFFGVVHEE